MSAKSFSSKLSSCSFKLLGSFSRLGCSGRSSVDNVGKIGICLTSGEGTLALNGRRGLTCGSCTIKIVLID